MFLPQLVEHVCGVKASIVTQLTGDDLQAQREHRGHGSSNVTPDSDAAALLSPPQPRCIHRVDAPQHVWTLWTSRKCTQYTVARVHPPPNSKTGAMQVAITMVLKKQTQGHRGTTVLLDCSQLTFSGMFRLQGNLCNQSTMQEHLNHVSLHWLLVVLCADSHRVACCTTKTAKLHCICPSNAINPGDASKGLCYVCCPAVHVAKALHAFVGALVKAFFRAVLSRTSRALAKALMNSWDLPGMERA